MTTIAANKRSIACDRQAVYNDDQKFQFDEKIFKLKPTQTERLVGEKCWAFCGFAGEVPAGFQARTWLANPDSKLPRWKDTEFLMLTSWGNMYVSEDFQTWELVTDSYAAIGTGAPFAHGALAAGSVPREAVLIAQQKDLRSGMGVLEYKFRKKKSRIV